MLLRFCKHTDISVTKCLVWYHPAGVESQLDKDAKIIVACATGGTMKPSQNLPEGQQSR